MDFSFCIVSAHDPAGGRVLALGRALLGAGHRPGADAWGESLSSVRQLALAPEGRRLIARRVNAWGLRCVGSFSPGGAAVLPPLRGWDSRRASPSRGLRPGYSPPPLRG